MSRYLGPIHHWLFKKIKTFEGIEKSVVEWGKNHNLPSEKILSEAIEKFGPPTEDRPLEKLIDTDNIHGWLQDKITRAELRHGFMITNLLNKNDQLIGELKSVYYEKGKQLGKYLGNNGDPTKGPKELYDLLHDYLLEGMPCDRVTEIRETSDVCVRWISHECLHKKYWDEVGGDIENFYSLRDQWIEGFVNGYDHHFRFERISEKEQIIISKEER